MTDNQQVNNILTRTAELLEYLVGNSWRWGLSHELVERMDSLRAEIRETIGEEGTKNGRI